MSSPAMGLKLDGGIQIFANHMLGNKRKPNVSTVFMCLVAFYVCLSSRSDRNTYAPDNYGYLDHKKKKHIPQFEQQIEQQETNTPI